MNKEKEDRYLTEKEMKELCKEYTIKLLEYQKTKLKCINLGWTRDEKIKVEIDIIDKSIKYLSEEK